MIIRLDFQPSQDLTEAEQDAATKLTTAENSDRDREIAVNAGARKPPAKGERPYMKHARGRAAIHMEQANSLTLMVRESIDNYEAYLKLDDRMEELDEEADELENCFWNAWGSVSGADKLGRLLFYPTATRSDYGNPSYNRNRNWWDRAVLVFRPNNGSAPPELPNPIVDFRDRIVSMGDRYGQLLDQVTSSEDQVRNRWKELVSYCREVRKNRRSSRAFLKEDFDGNMTWVDSLVAPPSKMKSKPTHKDTGNTPPTTNETSRTDESSNA